MIEWGLMVGFNYSGKGWASSEPNMAMHCRIWVLKIGQQSGGEITQTGWGKCLGGPKL